MNFDDLYPSKYLSADDVPDGKSFILTIKSIEMATMPDGKEKPALFFHQAKKGVVCNITNGKIIRGAYGRNTNDWMGKQIEIYQDETAFGSKIVPCLRVRIPVGAAATPVADTKDLDGNIPF